MPILNTESVPTADKSTGAQTLQTSWRLVHAENPIKCWDIGAGRYTIGSSQQCQIYLEGPDIRPLHCLVVNDGSQIQVTRWAAGAQLNGEEFSTAIVQSGDLLQFGAFELRFEAVGSGDLNIQSTSPTSVAMDPKPEPKIDEIPEAPAATSVRGPATAAARPEERPATRVPRETSRESGRTRNEKKLQHLWTANHLARTRCRALVDSMRALRAESVDYDRQISSIKSQLHDALDERRNLTTQLQQLHDLSAAEREESTNTIERLIGEVTESFEKANEAEAALARAEEAKSLLQDDLLTISRERKELQSQQDTHQHKCDLLQTELEQCEQSIDELRARVASSEEEAQSLRQNAIESNAHLSHLEAELAAQKEQFELLQEEHTRSVDQLAEVEQSIALRDDSIRSLNAQVEDANKLLHRQQLDADATIERQRAQLAELENQQAEWQDAKSILAEDLSSLRADLAAKSEAIESLQSQLSSFESNACEAEQQNAKYVTTIESLHEELTIKEQQRAHLAQFQDEALQQQEELVQEIADRDAQLERLGAELNEAICTQSSLREEVRSHQETIASLREELAQKASIESGLSESQSQIDRLRAELDEAVTKARSAREESADYVQTIEHLRDELQGRDEQFNRLESAKAEVAGELDELRKRLQETSNLGELAKQETFNHLATIEELRGQIEVRDCELAKLKTSQEGLLEEAAQLEKRIREAQEAVEAARAEVADRQAIIDALRDELGGQEQLQEQLAQRDAELAKLRTEHESLCETLHGFEESAFTQVEAYRELEEKIEAVTADRDGLKQHDSQRQQEIEELVGTLSVRDEEIRSLQSELASLEETRSATDSQAAQHAGEAERLSSEIAALSQECEALRFAAKQDQQQRTQLEQTLAEQQQTIQTLSDELEQLRLGQEANRHQSTEIIAAKESLAAELSQWQSMAEELEQKYQAELEKRNEEAQCSARQREKIELLEVDLSSSRSELANAQDNLARLQEKCQDDEVELEALRRQLASQQEAGENSTPESAKLVAERDRLAQELNESIQEIERLSERLQNLEGSAPSDSDQVSELQQTKSELELQVESQRVRLDELAAELEESQELRNSNEVKLAELTSQLEASQNDLTAAQDCLRLAEQQLLQQQNQAESAPIQGTEAAGLPESLVASEYLPAEAPMSEEPTEETAAGTAESAIEEAVEKNDGDQDSVSAEPAEALDHLRELSVWKDDSSGASESSNSVEAEEEPETEFQPTSFIDQYSHILPDEENEPLTELPTPLGSERAVETPVQAVPTPVEPVAATGDDPSDDEALESYMQNLMSRVRGDSAPGGLQPAAPSAPVVAISKTETATEQPEPTAEPQELEPLDLESLKVSSKKPPLPTDIRALRELANNSARGAIAKHSKKRHKENTLSKLFICIVAAGASFGMVHAAEDVTSPLFLGGAFSAVILAFAGAKLLSLVIQGNRDPAAKLAQASNESAE